MAAPTTPALGAHPDPAGTRFSLFSAHATAVELCLFDPDEPLAGERRLELEPAAPGLWELFVPGVGAGQPYGYRVHGPYAPAAGHRFNPAKLLADPRARAFAGELSWHRSLLGAAPGVEERPDLQDSAPYVPRSVVVAAGDGDGEPRPRVPWSDTVIYECHVRGLTRLHPEVPEHLRGTYLALAEPPVVEHLQRLGVTAVELLPVHQIGAETHLLGRGLPNYFGYSTLGWLAPHAGYATAAGAAAVHEFRETTRRLHRAGIEVLIDVVFNHSPEGDHRGPTLCLRGIDNRSYYRLTPGDLRRYVDYTGCGNTLDLERAPALELALDSLVYWVREMGVDGFRFDLASTLGRRGDGFSPEAAFFRELRRRPELEGVKLIAEPWDLGPGGYRLGHFPDEWAEWNDRFRDGVRSFWRGDPGTAPALRQALAGSPDLFAPRRPPRASINYVTSHDGFTLTDLVSYERKHNEANGEGNRDGHHHNLSRNWGVEGPTDSPRLLALRNTVRRSLLATLALARGVPMLGHGDELGRSQGGNNNAYCQDNEVTWVKWSPPEAGGEELLAFARDCFRLRRRLVSGQAERYPRPEELRWLADDGFELRPAAARQPWFAARLESADGGLLVLVNGSPRDHLFRMPGPPAAGAWRQVLNTAHPNRRRVRGGSVMVAPHSLIVLERGEASA